MGYAADHLSVSPLDWRQFTVEEANYIVEYCEERYRHEKEEAEKARRR